MDVLLTDEIQFRIGDKKYLTLYILRLKNSKHVFFQNKKANKEKKVIGKNFQEKIEQEISLPIWILYFYQTRTKGGEKL